MVKNNYIKELTLTEEQAYQMFGISREMIDARCNPPRFGIPLPLWFVHELYNILAMNSYIDDTDLNSFSYYFCCDMDAPPSIKMITWHSSMDVLRTLLYSILEPYVDAKCIKLKDIDNLAPLIFKSNKQVRLYNKSKKPTKKAEVMKDLIEPLCQRLTSSYKVGYFKKKIILE